MIMEKFNITLVKSKIPSRPYAKLDGVYAGPTWKNDIGLHTVELDIKSVYELMKVLSEEQSICMVYGQAVKKKIINTDRTMMNFEEAPIHLLTLDLDQYEGSLKDEYPTYEEAITEADQFIHTYLPPEFVDVSYVLRFSSSFLSKDTKFKVHIIFCMEESQYPREVGTFLKRENIPADATFYFNLTQPVFTAGPIFDSQLDPLSRIEGYFPRVGLIRKSKPLVPEGWQPYSVAPRKPPDLSKMPKAEELPGKVGSFCRAVPIDKAMAELGYQEQESGRYLAPTSKTGLAGAVVFDNGYAFSHHSGDPLDRIAHEVFKNKRNSFNSYDLMYNWAQLNKTINPELLKQFDYLIAEATAHDQVFQEELMREFIFRTEWLIEDGYSGENRVILDALFYDMSRSGLNEMSREYIFNQIKIKTNGKVTINAIKKTWKALRKDSAFYKNQYDPEAGLRHMSNIFAQKNIIYSHHMSTRGDFWCYNKDKRLWGRFNRDQTDAYIYEHLHEAMPLKREIELHKVDALTRLILKLTTKNRSNFRRGRGWSFKGGKIGILMTDLFKNWTVASNTLTLSREHQIVNELPITYDQWKKATTMPVKFNDFLLSSFEENYDKIDLIQEWMGYILADSYHLHKFLILEGVPGSGKSVLVKIIRRCIGPELFASLSLSRSGSQFGMGELPGKQLAVMSEAREIDFNKLRDAIPTILKIVGSDPIDVEAKHKAAITEVLNCKLMMVTNRTPVLPDDTGALNQRMIMVRMDKTFRDTDEEILGLDDMIIKDEIPSIIKWSLKGLERLSARKKFYIPESVIQESIAYRAQLNPLRDFINEHFIYADSKDEWVRSTDFTEYFREYLFRIGQTVNINVARKRCSVQALRSLDKRLGRHRVRDGTETFDAIKPLVPRTDLDYEFMAERAELAKDERSNVININDRR